MAYINLDSYWDSFSDDQLKQFVEHCHANGQRAGIYWSHFCILGLLKLGGIMGVAKGL